MATLVVVDRNGSERSVEARDGLSVMEAIREAGFDELLAMCGGCCSCATCHVFVDADYSPRLVPPSEDENDLLDSSNSRNEHSRLSCQLIVSGEMDGMKIQFAPEDC